MLYFLIHVDCACQGKIAAKPQSDKNIGIYMVTLKIRGCKCELDVCTVDITGSH